MIAVADQAANFFGKRFFLWLLGSFLGILIGLAEIFESLGKLFNHVAGEHVFILYLNIPSHSG